MTEIVPAKKNELLSEEDIRIIKEYDAVSKRYKVWKDSKQKTFEAFLKDRGVDSYTQDGATIYRTKDYKKKQCDTKKMKEEGVYDLYTREVWVKGSIRVQVNYDD